MSINLHLSVDGREIDLWQTPSSITSMCMIDDEGTIKYELRGKKARAAVARYLEWVRSFASQEGHDEYKKISFEHAQMVEFCLKNGKTIVVYAL